MIGWIRLDGVGGDGAYDEDTPDNEACVSQDAVGHSLEELSIGLRCLTFGFEVTQSLGSGPGRQANGRACLPAVGISSTFDKPVGA